MSALTKAYNKLLIDPSNGGSNFATQEFFPTAIIYFIFSPYYAFFWVFSNFYLSKNAPCFVTDFNIFIQWSLQLLQYLQFFFIFVKVTLNHESMVSFTTTSSRDASSVAMATNTTLTRSSNTNIWTTQLTSIP